MTLRVVVNGQERALEEGSRISDLVTELGLTGRRVAVERNRVIVPRAAHDSTLLDDGDTIEILHFVGGG